MPETVTFGKIFLKSCIDRVVYMLKLTKTAFIRIIITILLP